MLLLAAHMAHNRQSVYRPDIDGLCVIAVLAVSGYHAFPGIITGRVRWCCIFFVISGFLISSFIVNGICAKTFSLADFYARRIKRIFPSVILVLCATLGFGSAPGEGRRQG